MDEIFIDEMFGFRDETFGMIANLPWNEGREAKGVTQRDIKDRSVPVLNEVTEEKEGEDEGEW